MHSEQKLTPQQALSFKNMAEKRKNGMPVAYLLGYKYFYGLKFKVNENVLIPRPETEWLVDEALRTIKSLLKKHPQKKVNIIDVGTGSGAIAVSIAKHVDACKVKIFATDISEKALAVAKANAKNNEVKISFAKKDLLTNVPGTFDILIANLPYVPVSEYKKLYQNLRYEPKLALTDSTDTFVLISKLLKQVKSKLSLNGIILMETDPGSVKVLLGKVKNLFKVQVNVIKDIRGLNRFIRIY